MDKKDCKKFDDCSAPMCPLMDKTDLDQMLWFCDEEFCTIREYTESNKWIKNQKRISRRYTVKNVGDIEKTYTIKMLKKEKEKKLYTPEQLTALKERMANARKVNPLFQGKEVKI